MSGPKSSRYQLTPEQRQALAEARRRELKRKRGLLALSQHIKALNSALDALSVYCPKAELLAFRTGDDLSFTKGVADYTEKANAVIKACTLAPDATLEEVEKALSSAAPTVEALKAREIELLALGETVSEALERDVYDTLGKAAGESFASIDEKKAATERRIAYRRELTMLERDVKLPIALLGEIRAALSSLSESDDLKTFDAIVFTPLKKKIDRALMEYSEYEAEFLALRREYETLCAVVELSPLPTDCSKGGVEMLKRYIATLSHEIAYDDEESYIGDVLDQVMREMGYHVLADRTVDKKSGKRFSHELYSYRDGTVVNVTTASDGKITMELGKPDHVDRLPSESETEVLVQEMEAFCRDFAEIEDRLKARGVVVADRITMLPPTAEHAQIINVEDYAFRRESEEEKRSAVSWQTRLNKRRRVFRHIKIK